MTVKCKQEHMKDLYYDCNLDSVFVCIQRIPVFKSKKGKLNNGDDHLHKNNN